MRKIMGLSGLSVRDELYAIRRSAQEHVAQTVKDIMVWGKLGHKTDDLEQMLLDGERLIANCERNLVELDLAERA